MKRDARENPELSICQELQKPPYQLHACKVVYSLHLAVVDLAAQRMPVLVSHRFQPWVLCAESWICCSKVNASNHFSAHSLALRIAVLVLGEAPPAKMNAVDNSTQITTA